MKVLCSAEEMNIIKNRAVNSVKNQVVYMMQIAAFNLTHVVLRWAGTSGGDVGIGDVGPRCQQA